MGKKENLYLDPDKQLDDFFCKNPHLKKYVKLIRDEEDAYNPTLEEFSGENSIRAYEGDECDPVIEKATPVNLRKYRDNKEKYFVFLDYKRSKWYIKGREKVRDGKGKEVGLAPMDIKFLSILLNVIPPQTYTEKEIIGHVWKEVKDKSICSDRFTTAIGKLRKVIKSATGIEGTNIITTNLGPEEPTYGIDPALKFCIIYR